jgi:hypothetical protein
MSMSLLPELGAVGLIFCVALLAARVFFHIHTPHTPQRGDDIHTTHHNNMWGYYFYDPYGQMQSRGGFHTEAGAQRAARRHRDTVAQDLQKAMGL